MKSPGAPSLRREVEREFWILITQGLASEDAGIAVGASQAGGSRWFRGGGGMSPFEFGRLSGRYLSFAEREEIAVMNAQGAAVGKTLPRGPTERTLLPIWHVGVLKDWRQRGVPNVHYAAAIGSAFPRRCLIPSSSPTPAELASGG